VDEEKQSFEIDLFGWKPNKLAFKVLATIIAVIAVSFIISLMMPILVGFITVLACLAVVGVIVQGVVNLFGMGDHYHIISITINDKKIL